MVPSQVVPSPAALGLAPPNIPCRFVWIPSEGGGASQLEFAVVVRLAADPQDYASLVASHEAILISTRNLLLQIWPPTPRLGGHRPLVVHIQAALQGTTTWDAALDPVGADGPWTAQGVLQAGAMEPNLGQHTNATVFFIMFQHCFEHCFQCVDETFFRIKLISQSIVC